MKMIFSPNLNVSFFKLKDINEKTILCNMFLNYLTKNQQD
jgi:hypothetical protein